MSKPSILLGSYQFFVTHRGDRLPLDDLHGIGFLQWLRGELEKEGLRGRDGAGTHRHRRGVVKTEGNHTLYGRVLSGDTGFGSEFVNDVTGQPEFLRTPRSAELIPFYYQAYAPAGSAVGVLILQKLGSRSPYLFFKDELTRSFRQRFEAHHLSLHLEPYIAPAVLKRLEEGAIAELRFTRYSRAPGPLEDFVRRNGLNAEDMYFELRLVAKKGKTLPLGRRWKELVAGHRKRASVDAPETWSALGDDVRITVRINGKSKTLSFGEGREPVPYEDVSKHCERDSNSHPTIASIHRVANGLVSDIRTDLGIRHA